MKKKKKRKFDFVIDLETAVDTTWDEASLLVKNRLSTSLAIKGVEIEHPMGYFKQFALTAMGAICAIILLMILANI